MKLEQQVASLELCRKLKELGVKQESLFWWGTTDVQSWQIYRNTNVPEQDISAFTASELGGMLPPTLSDPYDIELYVYDNPRRYGVEAKTYKVGEGERLIQAFCERSEADARARMVCYLIENKLVTP